MLSDFSLPLVSSQNSIPYFGSMLDIAFYTALRYSNLGMFSQPTVKESKEKKPSGGGSKPK